MDLNMVLRDQARAGLQAQLDTAVTNGDTVAARKITDDIAKLDVQTAPKPSTAYGAAEVRAVLEKKTDWFGVDPKKSAKAVELGKEMLFTRFPTAEAYVDAVIKHVEAEFAPPKPKPDPETDPEPDPEADPETPPAAAKRKTDAPAEGEGLQRNVGSSARNGPWTKMSDAPAAVQAEIKRTADKFVAASAPKGTREKFIANALDSHYRAHQRAKGKK